MCTICEKRKANRPNPGWTRPGLSETRCSQSGWWTAFTNVDLTLDNYDTALRAGDLPPPGFAKNFVNTFIITIPSSILPIIIAAVAYALAWMKFKGRDWIFLGVVAMLVEQA